MCALLVSNVQNNSVIYDGELKGTVVDWLEGKKVKIVQERKLGEGAFKAVYSVNVIFESKEKSKSAEPKQKKLALSKLISNNNAPISNDQIIKITSSLMKFKIPNLLTHYACFQLQPGEHVYISELCSKGDLQMMVSSENPPSLQELFVILKDVCNALQHLHEKELVHRDVKLENIFVSQESRGKLGDTDTIVRSGKQVRCICSKQYASPVVFDLIGKKETVAPENDMWSFGVAMIRAFSANHFSQNMLDMLDCNCVDKEMIRANTHTAIDRIRQFKGLKTSYTFEIQKTVCNDLRKLLNDNVYPKDLNPKIRKIIESCLSCEAERADAKETQKALGNVRNVTVNFQDDAKFQDDIKQDF